MRLPLHSRLSHHRQPLARSVPRGHFQPCRKKKSQWKMQPGGRWKLLKWDTKLSIMRQKADKWNIIQIKNCYSSSREWKHTLWTGSRYFQCVSTKDLYPRYINNPYKSWRKRSKANLKMGKTLEQVLHKRQTMANKCMNFNIVSHQRNKLTLQGDSATYSSEWLKLKVWQY